MRPPPLATAMLRLLVPPVHLEFVEGDLLEEFAARAGSPDTAPAARRWFTRQVLRSIGPLLASRLGAAGTVAELAYAQLLVAMPVLALHLFWTTVLSLVPLRATNITVAGEGGSILVALTLAALGGYVRVRAGRSTMRTSPLLFVLAVLGTSVLLIPLLGPLSANARWLLVALTPLAALGGIVASTRPPLTPHSGISP